MKDRPLWYQLLWGIGYVLFKSYFRLRLHGAANVPPHGRVVLAANHKSYLDPVLLALLTRRKLHFLAKQELFQNPLFGAIIRALGAFPVRRGALDRTSYTTAIGVLYRDEILALFPEGTRIADRPLGPIHEGVARIAWHTTAPVVPVYIRGSADALPPGQMMVRPSPITVRVGPAVIPPHPGRRPRGDSIAVFHRRVEQAMQRLSRILA